MSLSSSCHLSRFFISWPSDLVQSFCFQRFTYSVSSYPCLLYTSDILKPKWDIFINYEGESYTTRERQEDGTYKWRKAMIDNLEEGYWYNRKYDTYMYFNAGGIYTIKKLLKTKHAGSAGIMEWQQSCKRRREDKRINEQIDKRDEVMKPIGEPPKGFRDWYQHNGFDGSNFIYYKGAGAKTGYCTDVYKRQLQLRSLV